MSVGTDGDLAPTRRKRRYWTRDDKRRIVDESLEEGASIAEIARRHEINANLLFTWRRKMGVELTAESDLAPMLPVTIMAGSAAEGHSPEAVGQMEIVLAEGDRIIVRSDVETAALSRVLKALSRR
jgi:transposase